MFLTTLLLPVWAQDDLGREADISFERGMKAFQDGRPLDALGQLLLSNRLSPNKNVTFNIARAFESLDRFDEAFQGYEDYLRLETEAGPRAEAEALRDALFDRVARFEIITAEPGATIYVDRKDLGARGVTPRTLALPPGRHTIILERPGSLEQTFEMSAETGSVTSKEVTMDPRMVDVEFFGAPEGAVAFDVDSDSAIGELPGTYALRQGEHRLRIEAPGYATRDVLVEIGAADSEATIDATLKQLFGRVVVRTRRDGAEVRLDDEIVGFTPVALDVPIGDYEMTVQAVGSETFTEQVVIEQDAIVEREVNLTVDLGSREVQTVGRRAQQAADAPATVLTLSREEIRDRGYSTIVDVLRDLPGSEVVEHHLAEAGSMFVVRGLAGAYSNSRFLILRDGVRLNPPGGQPTHLGLELSVRDVERIEVAYGPAVTLYGQDGVSGVINLITNRDPTVPHVDALLSYGTGQRFEAAASVTQPVADLPNGETLAVTASAHVINRKLDDWATTYPEYWGDVADVGQTLSPGPDAAAVVRPEWGMSAALGLQTSKSGFNAYYNEHLQSSSEGSYLLPGNPILFPVPQARWHERNLRLNGTVSSKLGEDLELRSTLLYSFYQLTPDSRFVFPIGDSLFLDDYKYAIDHSTRLESVLTYSPGPKLDVLVGATAAQYVVTPKATVPGGALPGEDLSSQAGSFTYYTEPGNPDSQVSIPRLSTNAYANAGAFAEVYYRPTSAVALNLGLRVDGDSRFDRIPVSPRLAVIVKPVDGLVLKGLYSQAFAQPANYFSKLAFDSGVALNAPTDNLRPERSRSFELSGQFSRKNVLVGLAGYLNQAEDLIIPGDFLTDANVADDEIYLDVEGTSTRLLTTSVNGGSSRVIGTDLFLKFESDRASLWASASYVDVVRTLDGVELGPDGISNVNGRLGLTLRPVDRVTFTPSFVIRSTPQNVPNPDAYNIGGLLDTPYEFNAHLSVRPTKTLEVFATGRNVTNNRYALSGVLSALPAETLSVFGGARVTF